MSRNATSGRRSWKERRRPLWLGGPGLVLLVLGAAAALATFLVFQSQGFMGSVTGPLGDLVGEQADGDDSFTAFAVTFIVSFVTAVCGAALVVTAVVWWAWRVTRAAGGHARVAGARVAPRVAAVARRREAQPLAPVEVAPALAPAPAATVASPVLDAGTGFTSGDPLAAAPPDPLR